VKRSAIKRTKPLVRQSKPREASVQLPKCIAPGCRARFAPVKPTQEVCSTGCAEKVGIARAAKAARKAEKQRREAEKLARQLDMAKREALKRLPELKVEAQEAFNEWVRERDHGKGCFVCGALLLIGGVGGGFDAGHIRARSQADHLRYDERNVHGQCKHCNAAGSTKDHEMREAAERLLGKEAADALYADNRVHKWQRDEVRAIRDHYRAEARELRRRRERGATPPPDSGAQLGACIL
jgi:hypothetical protein